MVNKVILLGNVGKDPEIKYFDNDVAVANFTLATSDRAFKTRDGQEVPERTEWHNIVAWRGLAKIAESYIKKGSQLYIERSEEHTSELQSRPHLVCRLLLEKKKNIKRK